MDTATCQYYLRVFHSKKIPVSVFSRLLSEFGSARALLMVPRSKYLAHGFNNEQIDLLKNKTGKTECLREIEEAQVWKGTSGNHLLCYESPEYPRLLREIDTPPPLLFVKGCLNSLQKEHFAMVGSRNATAYGKTNAFWIAKNLGKAGLQICSGLATGIDTKAHEGALDSDEKTTAVVGTGIDRVYPRQNAKLADRIIENGVIVSEFPLGTPPVPRNFPRRNRIISGLSEGVLVVEAAMKSGSLITARLALEQNRDVFALPGPIGSLRNRGCHYLIKQGAKLVEEPADILEELNIVGRCVGESSKPAFSQEIIAKLTDPVGLAVLRVIGNHGCLFNTLLEECELEMQELHSRMVQLEAEGLIRQEGGRYYKSIL